MRKRQVNLLVLIFFLLITSQLASAQEFPAPQGYVNDFARVLDQRSRAEIQVVAEMLKEEQGIELAVVTLQSTAPYDPTQYRTLLFEAWGVGGPEDSGLLILLSLDEGAIEVETGYGLEGVLPDGKIGAYLDNAVERYFVKGQFGPGLSYLSQAFKAELAGEEFEKAKSRAEDSIGDWLISFGIFILIVVLLRRARFYPPGGGMGGGGTGHRRRTVFVPTMRVPRSRGGFGGGSRGGGFGGFGGGRSGGGGAGRRF